MLLSQIISKDIKLHQKGGNTWEGICPWHDDTKASLQVHDGKDLFKCFVCGRGGKGAVRYIMESRNLSYRESLQFLKTEYESANFDKYIEPEEEAIYCLPANRFKKPSFHHYLYGNPTNIYEYRNLEGRLLGYTCRYSLPDGGKIVLPYNYIMIGDSPEWVFKGFKAPSLPYKAELIHLYPKAPICIVEGEKVADYGLINCRTMIFLAWVGGANAIKYIDWTCLKDRHVILIPDHDKEAKDGKGNLKTIQERPGNKAMLEIAQIIKGVVSKLEFVKIPEELPHKWDIADRKWNPGDLKYWIDKNKQNYNKLKL